MANFADNFPFVSLIIPCRNEHKYIGKCLDSILALNYPADKLEIMVVDGMSDDGTRDIIADYVQKHASVKLLDNPHFFVSHALNTGIRQSSGEFIIIMGAHSVYDKDFIYKSVQQIISHNEVDCVGGVCITMPADQTLLSKAIAIGLSSPFGVGNAYFRIGLDKEKYVDTVPFGSYRREVFSKIGYFDEDLTRGQDGELNARLVKSGSKILLHPDIKSYYYARNSLGKLWRMYYQYGYFKLLASKKIGKLIALRQLIPPLFVASLLIAAGLSMFSRIFLYAFCAIMTIYFAASSIVSLKLSLRDFRLFFILPLTFFTLHFAWGLGFLKGCCDFIVFKGNSRKKLNQVSLTR